MDADSATTKVKLKLGLGDSCYVGSLSHGGVISDIQTYSKVEQQILLLQVCSYFIWDFNLHCSQTLPEELPGGKAVARLIK